MKVSVLWLRENLLVLGELDEQDGTSEFREIASLEASVPLEPILIKSEPAVFALTSHFSQLFSSFTPQTKELEVWLPPNWGVELTIPIPSLPGNDIVEQLTWEVRKQLQTDLDYYLYLYRDRGDGTYDVRLMRPAIVSFWKKLVAETGLELSALRFASPESTLEDIITFDFKTLSVAGGVVSTIPDQSDFSLSIHKKERMAKRIFVVAAILIVISSVAYFVSTHRYASNKYHATNLIPLNAVAGSKPSIPVKPPTPVAKVDTAAAKPVATPTAPVKPTPPPPQTVPSNASLATFTGFVDNAIQFGTLEIASLVPGQAVLQLISDRDGSENIKTAWKNRGGSSDGIKTSYDGATKRLTAWLTFPVYKPSDNFAIPSNAKLTVDGLSATGSTKELLTTVATWQTLPYRISLQPEGNGLRVVVVK